ncbi:YopX protein [Vibrio phage 1.210.O._10N.222.52.C2]|nr:YopX protein [Vibrio phage 1.210.O._10N.222.52.C2]
MKNINFRAWNNELKRYFYMKDENSLMIAETNCTVAMWCSDGIFDECDADEVELAIGMKDFDGKDIFEGDFLSVQYDGDEETIHQVVWSEVGYPAFELSPTLGCECNSLSHIYSCGDTKYKVIGNIHEETK